MYALHVFGHQCCLEKREIVHYIDRKDGIHLQKKVSDINRVHGVAVANPTFVPSSQNFLASIIRLFIARVYISGCQTLRRLKIVDERLLQYCSYGTAAINGHNSFNYDPRNVHSMMPSSVSNLNIKCIHKMLVFCDCRMSKKLHFETLEACTPCRCIGTKAQMHS